MNFIDFVALTETFPGSGQDIKWEKDLCFLVGKKMYAVADVDPPHEITFRVSPDQFTELTERPGIVPAPYLARYHWITVKNPGALSGEEWENLVRASYEMTFSKLSKKAQREIVEQGQ